MENRTVEMKPLSSDGDNSSDLKTKDYPPESHQVSMADADGKTISIGKGASNDSDNGSNRQETFAKSLPSSKGDGTFHALSGLYAQIIVVVAAILVFTEVLHGPIPLLFFHGYLFTFLVGGGIICFIGVYMGRLTDRCPGWMNSRFDTDRFTASFWKSHLLSDVSTYLRIGALVFGLGTLISNGLEVASVFTMSQDCMDELNLAQPILRALFSFLQMHFLFMNVKEIVHYLGWFRHAALMHLVATNIALWIRVVLWESAKDWLEVIHTKHNSSEPWPPKEFNFTLHTMESDIKSSDILKHKPHHKVRFTTNCWWRSPEVEKTEDLIGLHMCLQNSTIGSIWEKSMPYLYPFIIQYCLVSAAIVYIIWSNLQLRNAKLQRVVVSVYGDDPSNKSQMSCAGSTKGLFLGLLVLVTCITALILFFVLAEDPEFNVPFVIAALRCAILGIALLAPVFGLFRIRKMKSKTKRERKLSELLQRVGMLAVYIYGICNMIVGGVKITHSQHLLLFSDGILMVFQACLQSLFIHQVSKKRLGPTNVDEKPGREIVIFLVFCNAVLWLFESFTTQHQMSSMLQKKFFGDIAWALVSRIVLPLVILYRFHSAVALMGAWRKSYKVKQN